jgi:hypothetical protein
MIAASHCRLAPANGALAQHLDIRVTSPTGGLDGFGRYRLAPSFQWAACNGREMP